MRLYDYDPEILNTEAGRAIYNKWIDLHRKPCSEEFSDFEKFHQWALESGFQLGMRLVRYNGKEPFSAENCAWVPYGLHRTDSGNYYNPEEKEQIERWNKTVNRIRLYCGMKPVEEIGEDKYGDKER